VEAIIAVSTLVLIVLTWAFYKLAVILEPERRK
jgi:hypothetical protein